MAVSGFEQGALFAKGEGAEKGRAIKRAVHALNHVGNFLLHGEHAAPAIDHQRAHEVRVAHASGLPRQSRHTARALDKAFLGAVHQGQLFALLDSGKEIHLAAVMGGGRMGEEIDGHLPHLVDLAAERPERDP